MIIACEKAFCFGDVCRETVGKKKGGVSDKSFLGSD
jgi:hypothetical protein